MNLRALRRFLAVVELGSINKAAAQLNVSQPSLSKDIQELEATLGGKLFLRTTRGVSLTDLGQTIFKRAKLVEAELQKLQDEADAMRQVSLGTVSAGVVPGFMQSQVLPTATLKLVERATRLTVNYRFGTRKSLLQPLVLGELDFILVGMDDEDETLDELIAEPLTTDRNALVVRAGHPILAQGDALHRALATYPWLVLSECVQLERALRDLVRKRGTPFNNSVIRTDSFHFFRSTLTASDCIGLTRYDAARPETEAGKVVELPLKQAKLLGAHRIGIMRRKDTPLTTAAQALVTEIYRQLGKKLPASLART